MTVGERIRKAREDAGLMQIDLANAIGVSKQTLYKYETGIITNIPSDKIEAAAHALNVTPSYIMGWDTSPPMSDSVKEAAALFDRLDETDQGRILGRMEEMLEADKYKTQEGSKAAKAIS